MVINICDCAKNTVTVQQFDYKTTIPEVHFI